MDFGRVITAMVTPFDENLQINWLAAEKLIDYLIDEQQSESLVVCGTTGESPTLSTEEKLALFEFVVKHAQGRCKVIAGTGSYNTNESIHLTRQAELLKVDGILLVAPYYNRPTQEGLYQHFKAIAESTSLPVMLYNVPARTGCNISAETTIRLSNIFNIIATKEASGDLDQITTIIANTPENFRLYSGDDQLTLPILAVGGYGIVSVASHVIGKQVQSMIKAFIQGDVSEAARMHGKLLPISSGLFKCPNPCPNPVAVKYALTLHGMNVGSVRLPLVQATEQEKEWIKALF